MQASQTNQVWFVGVVVAQGIIDVLGGPCERLCRPVYSLPPHARRRSLPSLSRSSHQPRSLIATWPGLSLKKRNDMARHHSSRADR